MTEARQRGSTLDQRLDLGDTRLQAGNVGAAQGGVADLAPGLEGLAVVVQVAIGNGRYLGHVRHAAEEVEHGALAHLGGRAQRQAGDGAQVVLELAALGAFDGPVPGVVYARGNLVGLEAAVDVAEDKLALARALVHQPRLLLLDEPLGALDALTRLDMQGLIERLWLAHRCTTVLVTHDVGEAVNLADRVVLVENGQVAMDTPVPLARSRNPADPAFVALEHAILQRVLQGPNAQPASTPTPAPAIHVSQLQWAL